MVKEDAALFNRPVTQVIPAALFNRRLHHTHPKQLLGRWVRLLLAN